MSQATKIEWTDETWNPTRGCSRVSEGCRHCYAERQAARFRGDDDPFHGFAYSDKAGTHWTGRVELVPEKLDEPLRRRRWAEKFARKHGRRPRVFVNSMSDLFHEALSNEAIAAIFGVMAAASWIDFQVLTKRAKRMREWFEWAADAGANLEFEIGEKPPSGHGEPTICTLCFDSAIGGTPNARAFVDRLVGTKDTRWPLTNVWLGTSVEDQAAAEERIPHLLATPAAVRFVSYEPALEEVEFFRFVSGRRCNRCHAPMEGAGPCDGSCRCGGLIEVGPKLDWIIIGGESGPGARPFDLTWARSTVRQCREAGVAVFVKQLGARPIMYGSEVRALLDAQHARDARHSDRISETPSFEWDDSGEQTSARMVLRDRKGGDPSEWPEDLRVREFPK